MTELNIIPWRAGDREAVIDLILGIQTGEFGFSITRADQPDLDCVPDFYAAPGGFWCAWLDGHLAGTVAIKDIGSGNAVLRKMFVAANDRGPEHRVAQRLLEHLITVGRAQGFARIWLGTAPAFNAAHRFYEKNGFVRITIEDLPAGFPRMAVDERFYSLAL